MTGVPEALKYKVACGNGLRTGGVASRITVALLGVDRVPVWLWYCTQTVCAPSAVALRGHDTATGLAVPAATVVAERAEESPDSVLAR